MQAAPSVDQTSLNDLLAGAAVGLLAGLSASWAMNAFQAHLWPAPSTSDEDPSTVVAAKKAWRMVNGGALPDAQAKAAGNAVHFALGASIGAAYGATAELTHSITRGRGIPFGISAALLLDDGIVPVLGLSKAPWKYGAPVHSYAMASHIVFGCVLEAVRGVLRPRRRSQSMRHLPDGQ